MPAKLDASENLKFLFACFQSTEPNRPDFAEVGKQFGIQPAAARMRLHRLKEELGGGKHETKTRKRKNSLDRNKIERNQRKTKAKEGLEMNWRGMADDDDDDDEIVVNGIGLKKEEARDEKDFKLTSGPRPTIAQVSGHSMGVSGPSATAMHSRPSTFHQSFTSQVPVQTPLHTAATNISISQQYPPPQIAAPHTPYFNPVFSQPERRPSQSSDFHSTTAFEYIQPMHTEEDVQISQ